MSSLTSASGAGAAGAGVGGFPGGGNMVFQSGDNIHTAAPREKHKNPGRHFPGILSGPIRSHSRLSHVTHT